MYPGVLQKARGKDAPTSKRPCTGCSASRPSLRLRRAASPATHHLRRSSPQTCGPESSSHPHHDRREVEAASTRAGGAARPAPRPTARWVRRTRRTSPMRWTGRPGRLPLYRRSPRSNRRPAAGSVGECCLRRRSRRRRRWRTARHPRRAPARPRPPGCPPPRGTVRGRAAPQRSALWMSWPSRASRPRGRALRRTSRCGR
mmetsp:Transcript_16080/g.46516  ORF Transcript_16080/g.46516 Transcript_16080/m.46516 type:complete len:201 (+) Transcript_16080:1268-1870(+)